MNSRLSRLRLSYLLLPVLFVVTVAANPQCAQVDDRITSPNGVITEGSGGLGGTVAECVQACNEEAKDARAYERDLHKANVEACGDDYDCLMAEDARHEAAMELIAADMQACKSPCHEQGGGSGGQ